MKKTASVVLFALMSIAILSCRKNKDNDPQPATQNDTPPPPATQTSVLPLSGHYVWTFEIPGIGAQESHMIFYADSVGYSMAGPAYSTNYTMIQDSYTEKDQEQRWIGVGKGGSIPKDGVYFVMFFKDQTDSTVTIYKHECDKGKDEAESFAYPEADATADHGWNVYYKK